MGSLGASLITSRQIEATRRVLTRHVRKKGKLWIRIFPDKAITARPSESRMGRGKGKVSFWSFKVKPGTIIIEITGLDKERSFKVLKLASYKLPVKVKAVDKKYNFYERFEVPELDKYKPQAGSEEADKCKPQAENREADKYKPQAENKEADKCKPQAENKEADKCKPQAENKEADKCKPQAENK